MESYRIFIDLSADLDKELIKNGNIGFIPMIYSINDKEILSDKMLNDEEIKFFYDEMKNGSMTKTSQITPFQYCEALEEYAKNGENIMYFTLSSGLSNTYNSALVAKETLEEKYPNFKFEVIDSLAATGGIGVLVSEAVKNREAGMTIEENAKVMKELAHKIRHWFYVEDLKYLKRGGRVSASKAFIAGALNIKPIMHVNKEGKLEAIGKKIGTRRSALELAEKFKTQYNPKYKTVYISHGDDLKQAEYVKSLLLEFDNTLEIHITTICPVIGCHSGPGTLALCHIGND